MASVTVKLPKEAHLTLVGFAEADHRPMSDLLADLIEQERRRRPFDDADAAYRRLQADPEAWADYQAEIRSMEGTLTDGLEDDPEKE